MYRIIGTLKGVAPILFNRMLDDELEQAPNKKSAKGRVTVDDRIEEAAQRVYRGEHGIYLPGWNFKRCLVDGSKKANLKVGKGSIAPYFEATLFPDRELYFGKDEPDFMHVHWGRRPPRTGGACMIRRPAFKEGWELQFGLTMVDDRRTPGEIERSLEEAGLLVGLGSWRPEYGRFIVTRFEKEETNETR